MFLVCPNCLAAFPDKEREIGFECGACPHKWDAPHPLCVSAYYAELSELELSLTSDAGDRLYVASLPIVIGRDSEFRSLQGNTAISRRHCQIAFDTRSNSFVVKDLQSRNRTTVHGHELQLEEIVALKPGEELRLAGVRLSLDARLRKAPSVEQSSNTKPGEDPIDLNFDGQIAFVGIDKNGRIQISTESNKLERPLVCVVWSGDRSRCKIVVLRRDLVLINGAVNVETCLQPADQLQFAGQLFEFSPSQRQLRPKKPHEGATIVAQNVHVRYGNKTILENVTCTIPCRSLTAIVGKSGTGKTTLIKVLAGFRRQDSGQLSVSGLRQKWSNYSAWALNHFALVPQHDVVHGELTVEQCLNYAARLRLGATATTEMKAERVSRALQDTDLLNVPTDALVAELSGGQRHRVNIAAELLAAPDGILLDEPTSGLDFSTERLVISVLKRLSSQGKTVVLVTHSLAILDDVDHVVFIGSGLNGAKVVWEGPPPQLKEQFGTNSWAVVFERLFPKEVRSVEPESLMTDVQNLQHRRSVVPKAVTLALRYTSIWASNTIGSVAILFGLPLLLGTLIRLAVSTDVGSGTDRLLFGIVSAFWIGMNQSVREIVRERTIFTQELNHHLGCASYLFSKIAFFAPVCLLQAILLSIPLKWIAVSENQIYFSANELRCPWWLIILMFSSGGTIGSLVGLFISSVCLFIKDKGEVMATFIVVLITLPQLLFSSKVLPSPGLAEKDQDFFSFTTPHVAPIPEHLSFLTFSRYLYLPLDAASRHPADSVAVRALLFNGTVLSASAIVIVIGTWITLECFMWWWKHRA